VWRAVAADGSGADGLDATDAPVATARRDHTQTPFDLGRSAMTATDSLAQTGVGSAAPNRNPGHLTLQVHGDHAEANAEARAPTGGGALLHITAPAAIPMQAHRDVGAEEARERPVNQQGGHGAAHGSEMAIVLEPGLPLGAASADREGRSAARVLDTLELATQTLPDGAPRVHTARWELTSADAPRSSDGLRPTEREFDDIGPGSAYSAHNAQGAGGEQDSVAEQLRSEFGFAPPPTKLSFSAQMQRAEHMEALADHR
jgi:hypothetical protein